MERAPPTRADLADGVAGRAILADYLGRSGGASGADPTELLEYATATRSTPRDRQSPTPKEHRPDRVSPSSDESALDFTKEKRERERKRIIAAMKQAEGNQSKAAEILGMSRRTLSTKLDLLPRPRKRLS